MSSSNSHSREDREPEKKRREEEEDDDEAEAANRCANHGKIVKGINRGAWTAEEDRKLAEVIEIYGPKRWKAIAAKAGLNRCGKSCRLRWMNYLRPNIKRGNISDQEEDLIVRLHKLLGNRWSLIAGRLPGRTDNEIKNYWNSHLSKKIKQGKEEKGGSSTRRLGAKTQRRRRVFAGELKNSKDHEDNSKDNEGSSKSLELKNDNKTNQEDPSKEDSEISFDADDFFDFSNENPSNLEWVSRFLQV